MKVPLPELPDILRVVFREQYPMVSEGASVTTARRMLPMLSNTTIPHSDMSTLSASLTEASDHFYDESGETRYQEKEGDRE
jgi:hypothetical protein